MPNIIAEKFNTASSHTNPAQKKEIWNRLNQSDKSTYLEHSPNRLSFAQKVLFDMAKRTSASSITSMFHSASQYSGNYVILSVEYKCLPLLNRENAPPVFLYQFVEVLEGLTNYEKVISEFPGLSYSQVNGAFGFLRRISQFNTVAVDIDEVEEKHLAEDEELIAELRHAISQREPAHVLTAR